jgi:cytidine deaminase
VEQKNITFSVSLDVYEEADLPSHISLLYKKAVAALDDAYAPYSKFKVSAAVLLENGEILTGTNQENAAYPAGICAEGTVMSACASLYPTVRPLAMFITVASQHNLSSKVVAPCGICRQRLLESEMRYGAPLELWLGLPGQKIYKSNSISNILPLAFTADDLAT